MLSRAACRAHVSIVASDALLIGWSMTTKG